MISFIVLFVAGILQYRTFLPGTHRIVEFADLDNDKQEETYILSLGGLEIYQGQKKIWITPKDWWVDGFVLADSNNDGNKDINLSVWKPGNYGGSKPFWVTNNDPSVKNHLFVFDLVGGEVQSVWQSSNLGRPNCQFDILDIDDDGENELVVIEGEYSYGRECEGRHMAVWKWDEWGFFNGWRSKEGRYDDLTKIQGLELD
ncbi:MAG: hypothetical protein WC243_02350 [Patescibacteria group bacterium]